MKQKSIEVQVARLLLKFDGAETSSHISLDTYVERAKVIIQID